MVTSGVAEEIEVIDNNGNDQTSLLGAFSTATFEFDETLEGIKSIGGGGKNVDIREGPVEFPITIECNPTSLEVLRLIGTYSSGSGTYNVTFPEDQTLPKNNFVRGQFLSDKYFEFSDVKFGEANLNVEEDGLLTISFDTILALDGEIKDGTLGKAKPSPDTLNWTDATFKIGGSAVGPVESATPTINRNIESTHGITGKTGADARKPVAIIEGAYDLVPQVVIKVENTEAFEEALHDASGTAPFQVQASKSLKEVSFDFGSKPGELKYQNAMLEMDDSYELNSDLDERLVELSGAAKDIRVDGST